MRRYLSSFAKENMAAAAWRFFLISGFLMLMVSPAGAITLLSPGSNWEYTFVNPTADPTWNTSTGVGGTWLVGPAPFGNVACGACIGFNNDFNFQTFWAADGSDGDDLWVRTSIDLTGVDLAQLPQN